MPTFIVSGSDYGQIIKYKDSQYFTEQLLQFENLQISASSAVVMDVQSDSFILEKNSEQVWPIASISKLMSVLVLLEDLKIDLDDTYVLKASDRRNGGRDYLFQGDEVANKDLLALALISSDNTAVIALISSAGLSEDEFVELMNTKAKSLGFKNTVFYDATGLNSANVSTAKEVSFLLKKALNNKIISDLVKNYSYSITTVQGRVKNIKSTNELLDYFNNNQSDVKIIGGKTGFNDSSGYCLGTEFSFREKKYISVVLNASSLNNRFNDTIKLVDKVISYDND
jgi:D-alanyl-D-alanine endopeptidase (penicillin-binding protein 7)